MERKLKPSIGQISRRTTNDRILIFAQWGSHCGLWRIVIKFVHRSFEIPLVIWQNLSGHFDRFSLSNLHKSLSDFLLLSGQIFIGILHWTLFLDELSRFVNSFEITKFLSEAKIFLQFFFWIDQIDIHQWILFVFRWLQMSRNNFRRNRAYSPSYLIWWVYFLCDPFFQIVVSKIRWLMSDSDGKFFTHFSHMLSRCWMLNKSFLSYGFLAQKFTVSSREKSSDWILCARLFQQI